MYGRKGDKVLSGGAAFDSDVIYDKFPHPSLGARSVRNGSISRISLDEFIPGKRAAVTVRLLDGSPDLTSEHRWPSYDNAVVARFLDLTEHAPELVFVVTGAASLNFALGMSRAFDFLDLPFSTENLEPAAKEQWESLSSGPLRTTWMPLFERVNRRG